MEFTFETQYNAKTLAVMAKALRKTVRKKRSRRSHIFGWIVMAFSLLLLMSDGFRSIATWIAVLIILIALLFEDRLNGYVAKMRLLPGTDSSVAVFSENSFVSTTGVGKSEWNYDKIVTIAETEDFFVFIFSANHAQLYDKRHLSGGTVDDFRRFVESVTGKTVQTVK